MEKMWEFSLFDWSKKGADGLPLDVQYVAKLIFSKTPKEARDAFFIVNEAVGQNGGLFPCALTVLRTVLASLSICDRSAKLECLELVANIAASDSAYAGESVAEDCLTEIRNAFWIFASGIQFDDPALIGSYADILGCVGTYIPSLNSISRVYLQLALTRDIQQCDLDLIKNTILDLEKRST
jgi:hypothetical protein